MELTLVIDASRTLRLFVTTMSPFGHTINEMRWSGGDGANFGTATTGICQKSAATSADFTSGSLDVDYGLQIWRNVEYTPVPATHGVLGASAMSLLLLRTCPGLARFRRSLLATSHSTLIPPCHWFSNAFLNPPPTPPHRRPRLSHHPVALPRRPPDRYVHCPGSGG